MAYTRWRVGLMTVACLFSTAGALSTNPISVSAAMTDPSAPTALLAVGKNASVALTWGLPVSTGGAAITDYVIQRSRDAITWTTFADPITTARAATVTGLTNGIAYKFRVAAKFKFGRGSWSVTATATPATVPSAPRSPGATGKNSSVALTWGLPASTGGAAITDYVIQRSRDAITWTTTTDPITTRRTASVSGLTNGITYKFRIAAKNKLGHGAWSTTVAAAPATTPSAPTTAVATGKNSAIALTWGPPASTGGAAVTDYVIQLSANGNSWTTVVDPITPTRTATITELTNGTAYQFRIAARNRTGQGPWSTIVHGTPVAPPALTITDIAPKTGSTLGGTSVTITGTGFAGATAVHFGPTAATNVHIVSDGQLTADAPSHPIGQVDISVTTPADTSAPSITARYTYTTPAEPTTCGPLSSNETWTTNTVHVLTCTVTIPNGKTLTLEPGVVVKVPGNDGFDVSSGGTLSVTGTAPSPVTITSTADDTIGGDTNGDGASTTPAIGDYDAAINVSGGATVNVSHLMSRWGNNGMVTWIQSWSGTAWVTIADSEFDHQSLGLFFVGSDIVLDVRRSIFTMPVRFWSNTDITGFATSGADANAFTGTSAADRVLDLTDVAVPTGKSWTFSPDTGAVITTTSLSVQGTLTLAAGSVLKLYANGGIGVGPSGTLLVNGTAQAPVTVTSIRDDTIGGDTNGDGSTTAPAIWDNFYGIDLFGGATANVSHLMSRWSGYGIYSGGVGTGNTSVTIADSEFDHEGAGLALTLTVLDVRRSIFTVPVSLFALDVTGFVTSGPDVNSFTGSYASDRGLMLESVTVPAGKSVTFSPDTGAVVVARNVYVEGTLTLAAGSNVKVDGTDGFDVQSGGTLLAPGTEQEPVTITSANDDTVGGDTNGDGSTTAPAIGSYYYSTAINVSPGATVTVSHLTSRWGHHGIDGAPGASGPAWVTVTDSEFDHQWPGLSFDWPGIMLDVRRSTFTVPVSLSGMDITGFVTSGIDSNSFVGAPYYRVLDLRSVTVPAGKSWTFGSDTGAVMRPDSINVYGTLTLAAGAIVKVASPVWGSTQGKEGFVVQPGGALSADGTALAPVTITSNRDTTIGGSTDFFTTPAIGDYATAINLAPGALPLTLTHLQVRYATTGISSATSVTAASSTFVNLATGLSVSGADSTLDVSASTFDHMSSEAAHFSGKVATFSDVSVSNSAAGIIVTSGTAAYRGSMSSITGLGISACNWSEKTCLVDAAYTDWGPAGPVHGDGKPLVCGSVTVEPWVGEGGTVSKFFGSTNCDGSPSPDTQLTQAQDSYSSALATKQTDCTGGSVVACAAIQTAQQCLAAAQQTAWSHVTVPGLPATPPVTGSVLDLTQSWLQTTESPVIAGADAVLEFGRQVLDLVTLYQELASAYTSCHL